MITASTSALALIVVMQAHGAVDDGSAPPPPAPMDPASDAAPPPSSTPTLQPAPAPRAQQQKVTPRPDARPSDVEEIAWASGAGGIGAGVCSAVACGWVPFVGAPIVGVATAAGSAGGAMYGAKDKEGWGTGIIVNASIAGAGGLIGASVGTALMTVAVLSSPPPVPGQPAPPLVYASIGGAVLLSAAGAVGGALGGAYALGSFDPVAPAAAPSSTEPLTTESAPATVATR